jgi:hypothetical protein
MDFVIAQLPEIRLPLHRRPRGAWGRTRNIAAITSVRGGIPRTSTLSVDIAEMF